MPRKKKTHEEFVQEVREKYGDEYVLLDVYTGANIKIKVRHNKCGYEWMVRPSSLLRGKGCPICGGTIKKTHDRFVKEIYNKYGNEYKILGEYTNNKTKIKVKHNSSKCNYHEYDIKPYNLLGGQGCPVCSGREAKLGINTIWDTDRWMVDLGVSEEDAKRHTCCSNKKITVKCPDCGREKEMKVIDIYYNKSIGCVCRDGKSYPEKFVLNLLEQLDVDFEIEYSPNWIKPKRYDFYIPELNCIIEAHGKQHYDGGFKVRGGRTLREEQENDKYKKEIALKNGIKHYIELDCRESNMDYIKNSIINSELNDLFDLSNINWVSCAEFANKNIVKEVCDYWNNKREDETTGDLRERFKLNRKTIRNYLERGTKLGWCSYDIKEESFKSKSKSGKNNGKKVEIFKNGQSLGVFPSCSELERKSKKLLGVKLLVSAISEVCTDKKSQYKGFIFKYVEEDNNSNISKIA
ncbi:TPA: hypothetical protein ACH354_002330 [Clostridium perfringens]